MDIDHPDIIPESAKPQFEIDEVVNGWRYVGMGRKYRQWNRSHVLECLFCCRLYDFKGSRANLNILSKRIGCTHNFKASDNIYPHISSDL